MSDHFKDIVHPTILVDETRVRRNIETLAARAAQRRLNFRPHFKTHQSAVIGGWFRDYGVSAITVSSIDMAAYFAAEGWQDITVAFPVNLRQMDLIHDLAQRIRLNVLVENVAVVEALERRLTAPVGAWVSVDAGYHREGLDCGDVDGVWALVSRLQGARQLAFRGLLAHFGNTYHARGAAAVTQVYQTSLSRLLSLKAALLERGVEACLISVGDTPSCTLVDDLSQIDEIRPGNFVFYDLTQHDLGVCSEAQIAAVVACPVVGVYPDRNTLLIYGGAIHLSKDSVANPDGSRLFGRVAGLTPAGWGPTWAETQLYSVSQEHGLIQTTADRCRPVAIGDVVAVVPAHICLAVSATKRYQTLTGQTFEAFGA
jgi:D-serine deaminase-like pyridoxal phosphate-dependent protein